jgi:hypothetical protein
MNFNCQLPLDCKCCFTEFLDHVVSWRRDLNWVPRGTEIVSYIEVNVLDGEFRHTKQQYGATCKWRIT